MSSAVPAHSVRAQVTRRDLRENTNPLVHPPVHRTVTRRQLRQAAPAPQLPLTRRELRETTAAPSHRAEDNHPSLQGPEPKRSEPTPDPATPPQAPSRRRVAAVTALPAEPLSRPASARAVTRRELREAAPAPQPPLTRRELREAAAVSSHGERSSYLPQQAPGPSPAMSTPEPERSPGGPPQRTSAAAMQGGAPSTTQHRSSAMRDESIVAASGAQPPGGVVVANPPDPTALLVHGHPTTAAAPRAEVVEAATGAIAEPEPQWAAIVGATGGERAHRKRPARDETPTQILAPTRSDHQRRPTRAARHPSRPGTHPRRRRATVAGVLALVAIGGPLLAGEPGHGADASAATAVVPETNILDALDAAAARPAAGTLVADQTAPLRAKVAEASRAGTRDALPNEVIDGANGAVAAVAPREPYVMPLARGTYRITSRYGWRDNPVGPGQDYHAGVDFAAPRGTPVYAVADGTVTYVGPGKAGRSGMLIILEHQIKDRTIFTWYNHEDPTGLYVEVGQQVKAGEIIAGVGNYGRSTGPHLHFEVHTDANLTTTEPLAWLKEQGAVDISDFR